MLKYVKTKKKNELYLHNSSNRSGDKTLSKKKTNMPFY